jgi:hypothetical protein
MSISERLQQIVQSIAEALGNISDAAGRTFGPKDDHYPATGAQPFEGDPYDERHPDR